MEWSVRALGQFLELLPEAAVVVANRDRVVAANARAADLCGYPHSALLHLSFLSILAPPAGTEPATTDRTPLFVDALAADSGSAAECTLLRGDGRRLPVEISHHRVQLEGESVVVVIVRDLTERKRAEAELRKSEERLRQAVRVSEIGIFDHDHASDVHHWSSRQYEIYGWPRNEPVTVPKFLARLHPDDREAIGAAIRRAHDPAGNGSFDVEHRIIRADGEVRWIATRSITLFAGEGSDRHPIRTVGACVDFTDRKLAEEGRERLAAMLDAAPDFVAITDAAGHLLYLNRFAHARLGIQPGDDLSRARARESRPDWVSKLLAETAVPTAIRDGVWRGETAFVDEGGHEVPFSQVLLAHRRADGEVAFLSTIARDISREKKLEAQFLQSQKMEAIGRLAGGVAHDFNNLLSVILNAATLAYRALPPAHPSREALEDVTAAGERAADLTRRMLAFSRKQVLRPQVVDVNEVLRGMTPMLRRLISEQIDQVTTLDPSLGLIQADPSQLEQVILNLVVNARDAMPGGGKLTIETSNGTFEERSDASRGEMHHGPCVAISVSDTGFGMDAPTKARLFEPFFTTKPVGQGTGLGLSMVFGIVKQSGGDISVESQPGRGTTFRVCFPRASDGARPTAPAAPAATTGTEYEVVLLVEDENQLRKLVANVLGQAGYRVLTAPGPREALAIAGAHAGRIDLLLTDVVMPHMSGKELADRVAAERPDTLVLFTTGYTEHSIFDAAADVQLLPKPFTFDELLTTVRNVLARAKASRR
jgi:PAS domain S-box-containing protein